LAKVIAAGASIAVSETPTATAEELLTSPGTTMGTMAYMSPEQARGEELDTRTDLFSFGALLYEMATGRMAFVGNSAAVIYEAILNRTPVPASQIDHALPPKLDEVIGKALEKDRKLRYQSAADMGTDLQRLKREMELGHTAAASAAPSVQPQSDGRRVWLGISAGVTAVAMAVGGFFYTHRAAALTEKDTIVLADFDNRTGDSVFDGTLREGLSVQLEQSPFLSIISDQKIRQMLGLMGQPAEAKLTPAIARELCQRTGSAAVLDGSIAQIGTQYLMTLRAANCVNGKSLASTEAQASDKSHVLDALGKAASEMRNKLGESLSTVHRFDTPLYDATTPSLEALQDYSLGVTALDDRSDFASAVLFFERATKLDSNFAKAFELLGVSYWNLGENNLASENLRKAYELRSDVSEPEKLDIESEYHSIVTGDLGKAQQSLEVWKQIYPRDWVPRDLLGGVFATIGQYEKSLVENRESLRLNPDHGLIYDGVVYAYVRLNRLEEARATAKEAEAKKLDVSDSLYMLDFLQNDANGMSQQVASNAGKRGSEIYFLGYEADTAAYSGRLKDARDFSSRAVALAQRENELETAARYEVQAALREALFGNTAEARHRIASALGFSTGKDEQYGVALVYALTGNSGRAQALADNLVKGHPEDTLVRYNYVPTLHAQLALSRNDASKAVEALQVIGPYELGRVGNFSLYPVYVRGEAYLAEHKGSEAAAEFQKILDHRGIVLNGPIGALAHLQIGRAYAMQGDTAKSKAAYQDFLTLWKDADPDVPILKEAKAEYRKLQ
jgi:eukaryotic-like serine/threonine-protein kinase